jgi:fumarate reductase flavoprotein subunit
VRISGRTFHGATMRSGLRALATWAESRRDVALAGMGAARRDADGLPPGWRGYGAKDYVDHADTASAPRKSRQSGRSTAMKDATVQESSCRSATCCRPRFRGRNERIDEPLDRLPQFKQARGEDDQRCGNSDA